MDAHLFQVKMEEISQNDLNCLHLNQWVKAVYLKMIILIFFQIEILLVKNTRVLDM